MLFKPEKFNFKRWDDRTTEEQQVFDNVYHALSAKDLTFPFAPKPCLARFALEGAVASGDFEKFKFIIDNYPMTFNHIITNSMIFAAQVYQIDENLLLDMFKYVIDIVIESGKEVSSLSDEEINQLLHKVLIYGHIADKSTIKFAAMAEFYEVGDYLLSYNMPIGELKKGDLFFYGSNLTIAFTWLVKHGATVDSKFVGSILCQTHLQHDKNQIEDIEAAIQFLLNLRVTSQQQVEDVRDNCDLIANIIENNGESYNLAFYLKQEVPFSTVKFLIENGIAVEEDIFDFLVNYPDPDTVKFILQKAADLQLEYFYKSSLISEMNYDMTHCESNLAVAEYLNIKDSINWQSCDFYQEEENPMHDLL